MEETGERFTMVVPKRLVEKIKNGEIAIVNATTPKEITIKLAWLVRLKWLRMAKIEAEKWLKEFWALNTSQLYPLANAYANILLKLGEKERLEKFIKVWDDRVDDEFAGLFVRNILGDFPW